MAIVALIKCLIVSLVKALVVELFWVFKLIGSRLVILVARSLGVVTPHWVLVSTAKIVMP